MHDSFTPLGGLVPMWLMQLGEVIFGGVGSGLYGMLAFAVVAVFIAGLMVGRTPEYLGKKIEAYEMKMASLAVLIPCAGGDRHGDCGDGAGRRGGCGNPGRARLQRNPLRVEFGVQQQRQRVRRSVRQHAVLERAARHLHVLARFPLAIAMLAMAGSLAAKRHVPESAGTLPTHTPLFVTLLACVVIVVGALTFLPGAGPGARSPNT
jgi:K+-transporting ATPase ATPase A chain